jgi:hypothetical protein
MTDGSIKQIQITGGAELVGGRKKRASRKKERGLPISGPIVSKSGGGSCTSGYIAPSQVIGPAPLDQAFKTLTQPGQNPMEITKLAVSALPNNTQAGGKKVELRKSAPGKKVHLHSKKSIVSSGKPLHSGKKKTRKIVLGLVSLQKRQTRAKKISERMKEMPLDKLKKQLVEQGLIKKDSKAPESVLRQIAADAQIVGGNGL